MSRSIVDIMQFLKLINFYRYFIKNFNKIIILLIEMLKKSQELKKKRINENETKIEIKVKVNVRITFYLHLHKKLLCSYKTRFLQF